MKDWMRGRYGEGGLSYDRLRQAATEAWEAVGQDQLEEFTDPIHNWCQVVIDVKGLHTKY